MRPTGGPAPQPPTNRHTLLVSPSSHTQRQHSIPNQRVLPTPALITIICAFCNHQGHIYWDVITRQVWYTESKGQYSTFYNIWLHHKQMETASEDITWVKKSFAASLASKVSLLVSRNNSSMRGAEENIVENKNHLILIQFKTTVGSSLVITRLHLQDLQRLKYIT